MQRRKFIHSALFASAGFTSIASSVMGAETSTKVEGESLYMIGPMEGYSPQIGTLVSMLNYNRSTIINTTKNMTMADLDYLFDAKANTIGALIMHLGAVDKWYQINSFEGRDEFTKAEKEIWEPAMNLGDEGRKKIKGHELKYYIDLATEVREKTLTELRKKDDAWLLAVDPKFGNGKTNFNTYWKWFHVCEHESNHRGQITWLKNRLPGAKEGGE
ncbi:DinB family protein [soil metagenome]